MYRIQCKQKQSPSSSSSRSLYSELSLMLYNLVANYVHFEFSYPTQMYHVQHNKNICVFNIHKHTNVRIYSIFSVITFNECTIQNINKMRNIQIRNVNHARVYIKFTTAYYKISMYKIHTQYVHTHNNVHTSNYVASRKLKEMP